ncbi:hypothetical protein M408DRAFT_333844 [Serendipita vermifera MAFF 305830]|uniref:Uncharacterized protein n=1 Tax=Serendipita vermifera MAFF 305830 TaxID=933852 RepID=A0A0C2WT59_SERVB|nr:hypothetical protein M408DRAFT_333844 [Serendipita vermifera MAFF 305830]
MHPVHQGAPILFLPKPSQPFHPKTARRTESRHLAHSASTHDPFPPPRPSKSRLATHGLNDIEDFPIREGKGRRFG